MVEPVDSPSVAALVLSGVSGVGPVRFRALVDRFGCPGAALAAPASVFAAIAGRNAANQRGAAGRAATRAGYGGSLPG